MISSIKRPLQLVLLAASALLVSCAAKIETSPTSLAIQPNSQSAKKIVLILKGSDTSVNSSDWQALCDEWNFSMRQAADEAGMAYAYQKSVPTAGSDSATAVTVYVNDYHYVSVGARIAFSTMTGNAYIDSEASFTDVKTGKFLGKKKYYSSSKFLEGMASAMTDKQIRAICAEIIKDASRK
jgi:hypothetical protein